MAHKKGAGSTKNGRDSNAKCLGVKKFGGELVLGGQVLVRQRNLSFVPGRGVCAGRDNTLFAKLPGTVKYRKLRDKNTKLYNIVEVLV